ncbi:MAG: response regulator [Lentisphaerae bacterium]|nr:MAG: response regulator [Lentisphaerota bacterium]
MSLPSKQSLNESANRFKTLNKKQPSSKNVAVVSSRDQSLDQLFSLLKTLNYHYQPLNSAPLALHFRKNEKPSIMIIDWEVQTISGLDIVQQIRALDKAEHTYTYLILFASRALTPENCQQAINAGVDDFLTFPPDLRHVWMRLHVAEKTLQYMQHLRELRSFIPICSYCKKIRQDQDYWQSLEQFLANNMEVELELTVCPECEAASSGHASH